LNLSEKIKVINLSQLTGFKAKEIVDTEKLILAKIISKKDAKKGVKVLGGGDIETALIIKLSVSDAARKKIEKVGGKVMDA